MAQIEEKLWVIAQVSIQTVSLMVLSPIFWLTIWFTYRYYARYEWDKASARRLALASSLEGIGAGFLVIWLTTLLGLVICPSVALYFMGPVSMVLSLLRPRFLCLSYGAGAVILLSKLIGAEVDAVGISCLVALLHLAEGLLVVLFGGNHTVTIYRQKRGRIQAGSGIYRFWPVPVCLLILVLEKESGAVDMPRWWPLLSIDSVSAFKVCGLLPLAVTLGYSDLSGRRQEVKKRRRLNGALILCYATVLLGISL